MRTRRTIRRADLMMIIIRKAGLPNQAQQPGYLSRRQLQALLLFIENKEHEVKTMSANLHQLTESITGENGGSES